MKCKLSTINGWCGIFNKSCKECMSPQCEFIKKAYRQGRVEGEYFSGYKSGWIPVSEKLPEKNGDYIVSLEDAVDTSASFFNGKWFMSSFDCISREYGEYEVVAWRPIPAPYKGGDTDDEAVDFNNMISAGGRIRNHPLAINAVEKPDINTTEQGRSPCNTCRYSNRLWDDYPCYDCIAGFRRYEPVEQQKNGVKEGE